MQPPSSARTLDRHKSPRLITRSDPVCQRSPQCSQQLGIISNCCEFLPAKRCFAKLKLDSSDGRAGALRSKGPKFESRSGSYETSLQKSNLFDITLVAEDHEPSMGIVCKPKIGSGCRAFTKHAGHG